MANSFRVHYFHCIWSTKNRENIILPKIKIRLYPYMCSIANRSKGHIHEIGGTANHVHLLMELSNLDLFTDLIKTIKANSTSFIKSEFPEGANFSWQDGYGSFSVSYSQIESVKKYIRNQEVHHAKQSFEDEFLKMLKLHNSVVDPKYIFG